MEVPETIVEPNTDMAYEVSAGLLELYQSGNLADVTVRYGTRTKKAHKVVLCATSRFFVNALLKRNFLESKISEIVLHEGEEEVIEAMLIGIYGGHYPDIYDKIDRTKSLLFNIKVYSAADCYTVPQVCQLAVRRIKHAVDAFDFDDMFGNEPRLLDVFIKEVYKRTPPTDKLLRALLTHWVTENRHSISKLASIEPWIKEIPEFACDMAMASTRQLSRFEKHTCEYCDMMWATYIGDAGESVAPAVGCPDRNRHIGEVLGRI